MLYIHVIRKIYHTDRLHDEEILFQFSFDFVVEIFLYELWMTKNIFLMIPVSAAQPDTQLLLQITMVLFCFYS